MTVTVEQIRAYCERKAAEAKAEFDSIGMSEAYSEMGAYNDVARFITEDGAPNYDDRIRAIIAQEKEAPDAD